VIENAEGFLCRIRQRTEIGLGDSDPSGWRLVGKGDAGGGVDCFDTRHDSTVWVTLSIGPLGVLVPLSWRWWGDEVQDGLGAHLTACLRKESRSSARSCALYAWSAIP